MMTVLMLFIQTTLGAPETDGPFNLFNAESGIKQEPARWVSGGRLYYINTGKCAGVSGQTDGSTLVYSDCDEKSHLQQWECSNNTLLTLKGQTLYLHVNDNNGLALSRDTGPRSRWIISGTTDGPCSRTHRELFTIEGNAFGRPCQFPFRYKDQWYGDCTSIDSSNEWLWCAIETNYQDKELWGYCPSKSMEHWHKNPVTGAFYQVNLGSALTWHQARTSCQQQGADLASITEPLEQTYLTGLSGTEHVPLWTGLNALEEDSGWQWISGKPFRYLRWDSGHPLSDPGQICGLVNLARQSYWQSSLCSKSHGYICQKDPPTPAAHPEEIGFCSSPWIPYAARCYLLQRTKKTWTEAQTECRKDGGDLASIHNVEQHSFVMSQLGYAAADELWIGMNDVKTPLLFEWSDQSAVTFIRWEEAMPMGGNCVLVRGEGRYATQVCENQHGFICMKKSSSKPSGDQVDTYPGCKPHWTRHGSYCYFVGPEIKTFDEAKETCKSSQSYLADVSSRVDNAFLISLVGSRPEQHFWIGLSNRNHIDIFSWTNSNRVRYTHWNAQMPGSRQGCVAMTTGTLAGLWDVLSCTNQEKYICKHLAEGAGPTPEPITPVPPRCHEGWYPVGSRNYCFKFFTGSRADKKTWFEAQDFCRVIGGDLLSIHSSMDLQSMHHVSHGTSWIGLSAQDPNTGYAWTDGSPLSFQHWIEGEPNNYNSVESCAEITISLWDEAGSWNDVDCESYNDWLCEIPKGMTPLPPPNNTIPEYNVTEDGWLEYGGSQYYFNTELLTMENARHYCQQRHGDLVVITGLTENIFLWKKINKENLGSHYIGLTVDLDRSFGWMDGSPVVFQRWDNNQPDFRNNDENCVVMYSSMGFWHDNNCGEEIRSICKRSGSPPVNSTVPPTVPPTGGCPPKWVLYQSKCYNLIENLPPSTWLNARSICQTLGGNLASIVNRREQVFLTTQMTSGATDLWIGLSNLDRDTFVWTDGQAVKYLNLGLMKRVPQIFPSRWYHNSRMFMDMFSGASQCIVMTSSFSNLGKWETRSCNDTHGFICQRKVDSGIPVPAPTVLPSGWVKLANDSYKVLTQNWTWPEARMKCEAEEGQLASTLDALSTAYLELQALNLQTPLWIGLNRNETEGYFRWIDGWKLSMAQWAQDEPSRDRPCVYLDVKGTWKTALCNHTYPSVCKKSLAVPPTASPQHPGKCIQEEEISGRNSPWSWLPFRGHCYSFVNNDIEWADASISCISNGASLVSIEDPAELDFIKSNLEFLKDSYSSFWIGLYRTHLGQWKWLDQTVSDFINWAEGQPQGSFHYSYGYMLSSDGTWGTAPRWADKPYICKKPKVLPETPPTHVSLKTDQRRVYSGLAVVVVLAAMCLMGLTALMLYKKTGRPLPSFTKPLVFSAGRRAFDNPLYTDPVTEVDPSMVDTSQLVNPVEAQPMITL